MQRVENNSVPFFFAELEYPLFADGISGAARFSEPVYKKGDRIQVRMGNDRVTKVMNIKRWKYWIASNIVGLALYLYFASWIWTPADEREVPCTGDGVIWMLSAFPVLILYAIANFVWIILILRSIRNGGEWHLSLSWVATVIVWVAAFSYGGSRHCSLS